MRRVPILLLILAVACTKAEHEKPVQIATKSPTSARVPTIAPKPYCTGLRFGIHLGPDSVDDLYGEGSTFGSVSEIAARFDCRNIGSEDQISFKWYRNGTYHRTFTYNSDANDRSGLISWSSLPGKYVITLLSRHGYLGDLDSGRYELVVYVDDKEALRGSILIE
jgi:hypothetical protein